jgi:multiple sugar transport system substrate-binding protein
MERVPHRQLEASAVYLKEKKMEEIVMKKGFKKLVALAAVAAMLLSLTACSGKEADTGTDQGAGPVTQLAGGNTGDPDNSGNSDKEVTLRMLNWGSTNDEDVANNAIARFNEVYPNVTVEQTCVAVNEWSDFIQKWISMVTTGEAPDIINVGLEAAQMAVDNDLILPLDDIVKADSELSELLGKYPQSLIDGFSGNGKLYGLPSTTQTMVIYYNKAYFDKMDIAYPEDGWTWDDFKKTAEALTFKADDGTNVYGFGLAGTYFQLTPWWTTDGTNLTDAQNAPSLNSDKMIEAVTFINGMVEEGIVPDPISSDIYTMFSSGQVAMVGAGRWVLSTWADAGMTTDKFGSVQWPVNTDSSSVYGGSAWCISAATKEKDITAALLKEMVSDDTLTEAAQRGQGIPPLKALATDAGIMNAPADVLNNLWSAVEISAPIAAPTYFGDLQTTFIRALDNVFSGSAAPKDALDQAQAELEDTIANK